MQSAADLPPAGFVLALAVIGAVVLAMGIRPALRWYLHLAAALYTSFAISAIFSIAPAFVAPVAIPAASGALMLATQGAFRHPPSWRSMVLVLGFAFFSGVAVAFGAALWLAALVQLVTAIVLLIIARRGLLRGRYPSILLACGAVAQMAAACAAVVDVAQALTALALFSAAGLLGVCLAVARISDTIILPVGSIVRPVRRRPFRR